MPPIICIFFCFKFNVRYTSNEQQVFTIFIVQKLLPKTINHLQGSLVQILSQFKQSECSQRKMIKKIGSVNCKIILNFEYMLWIFRNWLDDLL